MKDNYLFALVWSNFMAGLAYQEASQKRPDILHYWPSKNFGGQTIEVYKIDEEFALIIIRPNGDQMPTCPEQYPQSLPISGCPVSKPLQVDAIISWSRKAFNMTERESAYLVPFMEAPIRDAYKNLEPDLKNMLEVQIAKETQRLYTLFDAYSKDKQVAKIYVQAEKIKFSGDVNTEKNPKYPLSIKISAAGLLVALIVALFGNNIWLRIFDSQKNPATEIKKLDSIRPQPNKAISTIVKPKTKKLFKSTFEAENLRKELYMRIGAVKLRTNLINDDSYILDKVVNAEYADFGPYDSFCVYPDLFGRITTKEIAFRLANKTNEPEDKKIFELVTLYKKDPIS
jgi:hypothetical protein